VGGSLTRSCDLQLTLPEHLGSIMGLQSLQVKDTVYAVPCVSKLQNRITQIDALLVFARENQRKNRQATPPRNHQKL
jgi:hypothetical protein